MNCERCNARRARYCVWDEVENEAALIFGDQLIGMLLCGVCLVTSELDGPWDGVELLEPALELEDASQEGA